MKRNLQFTLPPRKSPLQQVSLQYCTSSLHAGTAWSATVNRRRPAWFRFRSGFFAGTCGGPLREQMPPVRCRHRAQSQNQFFVYTGARYRPSAAQGRPLRRPAAAGSVENNRFRIRRGPPPVVSVAAAMHHFQLISRNVERFARAAHSSTRQSCVHQLQSRLHWYHPVTVVIVNSNSSIKNIGVVSYYSILSLTSGRTCINPS